MSALHQIKLLVLKQDLLWLSMNRHCPEMEHTVAIFSVDSNSHSELLTSVLRQIPFMYTLLQEVTIHIQDRSCAASLQNKNCAKISVFCVKKKSLSNLVFMLAQDLLSIV